MTQLAVTLPTSPGSREFGLPVLMPALPRWLYDFLSQLAAGRTRHRARYPRTSGGHPKGPSESTWHGHGLDFRGAANASPGCSQVKELTDFEV